MINKLLDKYYIKNPLLRRFITRLLYGKVNLDVLILNTEMVINSLLENGYYRASKFTSKSSFLRDEISVIMALGNRIDNEKMFIDIGANIGIFSSILSRFKGLYTDFEIHAFEVHPDTFSRLNINANKHGFKAYNIGLGRNSETCEFICGAVSHVTTRIELANSYNIKNEKFIAKISKLEDFSFQKNLIIKIDVEGQEFDVLQGAKKYFDNEKIDSVYLDGYKDKRCYDFLKNYNYELYDVKTMKPADKNTFSLFAVRNKKTS